MNFACLWSRFCNLAIRDTAQLVDAQAMARGSSVKALGLGRNFEVKLKSEMHLRKSNARHDCVNLLNQKSFCDGPRVIELRR